jgi:hypothetical protein
MSAAVIRKFVFHFHLNLAFSSLKTNVNLCVLAEESTKESDGDEKWHYQIWLTD